jgi:hypothetical protein
MFEVIASGTPPLSYQWQRNGTNLAGATGSVLEIMNAQPSDAGTYRVIVSNGAGSLPSAGATLTVLVPPNISQPPQSQTVVAGTPAQFNVIASGTAPLRYQWRFNGSAIDGANDPQFTINNVQPANAGNYTVVVTNSAGATTSSVATLTVLVPPAITDEPDDVTVLDGETATFTVAATGTAPLGYQWRKDGINIPGANGANYSIAAAHAGDEGFYTVVVTNSAGSATSQPAQLRVNTSAFLTRAKVRGDGAFEFQIVGQSNRTYEVQFTTNFDGWTPLTNVFLNGPQAPVVDPARTNTASRFYRVRLNP